MASRSRVGSARRTAALARLLVLLGGSAGACATPSDARVIADTLGAEPANVRRVRVQARKELVENSGLARSVAQPGIIFTINDSGNEPLLFALDTTGADRGVWRIRGARNTDWESVSVGPCGAPGRAGPNECVYIGDTGDNDAARRDRTIYRVVEPKAEAAGFDGSLEAQPLVYRYADGAHDVEAMYVAPNGSVFLITKRQLRGSNRERRPALVFEVPASAWRSASTPVVAALVDSLSIVPGSAPRRMITDAALSHDGRRLAVRTYTQIFVFVTDSATGRVVRDVAPGVCNLAPLGRSQGEGVTWYGDRDRLIVSSEGRNSPMIAVDCPMPSRPR